MIIKTEKGPSLNLTGQLESQWMGTAMSLWVTVLIIVSAKPHHRATCPLSRALVKEAIETEKGPMLNSTIRGDFSG
jgi:hypothetical protein